MAWLQIEAPSDLRYHARGYLSTRGVPKAPMPNNEMLTPIAAGLVRCTKESWGLRKATLATGILSMEFLVQDLVKLISANVLSCHP